MPVPNQIPYIIYNANGLTTVFPFEFYIINAGDVQVTINGDVVTSGYSVSGVGNVGGGDVTFVTPPANGSVVMLERVVPTYRLTDYQDNGDLLADTVNKDFDRLWMAIQRSFIYLGLALRRPLLGGPFDAQGYRIAELADPVNAQDAATKSYVDNVSLVRALRVPESFVPVLPPADQRANKLLAFNAEGNPIMVLPPSGSASDVMVELAKSTGAGLIGATDENGNLSTVQDILDEHQGDIDSIEGQINQTGHVFDLAREGTATLFGQRHRIPHRLVNKTIPNSTSKKYDHFGIMDIKADGTLYQMFRRGATHTDEGSTMYSYMQSNGVWSTPFAIVSEPGVDCRGASGGTAPDGSMYCAGSRMVPNPDPSSIPNVFLGAFVYRSKDYGVTWQKVGEIANPSSGAYSYIVPYGKIANFGAKLVIPAYSSDSFGVVTLTYLESTDNGDNWAIGSPVYTGSNYNESAFLDCGGGVIICISRTGDGKVQPDGSRRLRQFISPDGGVTWTDQGQVIGPDASEEIGWELDSPSLSLVYSPGGTPYVLLFYTARRGSIRYRYCPVTSVTAGSSSWSIFYSAKSISTEFESGYQSQVVLNNVVLVNYYATLITDSVTVPTQLQVPLGILPDYDSGWFAVSQLTTYTKNHGLQNIPSMCQILFSTDAVGKVVTYPAETSLYYNGSTTVGAGIAWQVNPSGFTLRTGTYMIYQGVFGNPSGSNPTSGYARILAWK